MADVTTSINASRDDDRLVGLDTAAEWLGLSVWTLRKWAQEGKIKSLKLGSRRLIATSEIRRVISVAKGEQRK